MSIQQHQNVGLNVGLNKTERKVIEFLIENPRITSVALAERIGVTTRTIERTFKSLQEKKMIQRIGSKRVDENLSRFFKNSQEIEKNTDDYRREGSAVSNTRRTMG